MYTVVIPTFNSSERINKTLNSVFSQTIQPNTVVIVDDMSDDIEELKDIVAKLQNIKINLIVSKVKKNAAHNRNIGWRQSNDKYVFFLDSDDEWLPQHAENTLNIFDKNPSVGCVFNHFLCCTYSGEHPTYNSALSDKVSIIKNHMNPLTLLTSKGFDFRSSTIALKKEVFNKVHFDFLLSKHQDWDLFISLIDSNITVIRCSKPSVILNEFGDYRMSSRNNLEASIYFILKWKKFLNHSNFNKLVTQLFRAALKRKSKVELKQISGLPRRINCKFNFKNQVVSIFGKSSSDSLILAYFLYSKLRQFFRK